MVRQPLLLVTVLLMNACGGSRATPAPPASEPAAVVAADAAPSPATVDDAVAVWKDHVVSAFTDLLAGSGCAGYASQVRGWMAEHGVSAGHARRDVMAYAWPEVVAAVDRAVADPQLRGLRQRVDEVDARCEEHEEYADARAELDQALALEPARASDDD